MAAHIIAQPKRLGENLRRLRQARERTVQRVAEAAGLSKAYISMIESGDRAVHWSVLLRIVHALDETLCGFLSKAGSVPGPEDGVRTRLNDALLLEGPAGYPDADGEPVQPPVNGERYTHILTPYHDGMRVEVVYLQLPPHSEWTPEPLFFPAHVTAFTQQGKALLVLMNRTEYVAEQGESLYYDASEPHLLRNYTDHPMQMVLTISPACF